VGAGGGGWGVSGGSRGVEVRGMPRIIRRPRGPKLELKRGKPPPVLFLPQPHPADDLGLEPLDVNHLQEG